MTAPQAPMNDPANDQPGYQDDQPRRTYWGLEKKIPVATIYGGFALVISSVWYFSGIVQTQVRHAQDIAAIYQAIAPVQSSVSKITDLQLAVTDLRTRVDSEATHERRISMLEAANAEFARALGTVSDRLARIEAKQDTLLNQGRSH